MTIREIVRNGKGKAGHWHVEPLYDSTVHGWQVHSLYHYSTRMLVWRTHNDSNLIEILSVGLGNGSVSDQQGMNVAFGVLGAPHYYYSRKGGAKITVNS